MPFLAQVFDWFTTSANWTGSQGIPTLFWHQLKLSVAVVADRPRPRRRPRASSSATPAAGGLVAVNAANAFRAVPTLALLTLLAIQPAISLKWGGFLAAWLALTALAIPPILTNTYVGMREVDADVRDAAKAMGLTGARCCARVEAPLAAPLRHGRGAHGLHRGGRDLDAGGLRQLHRPGDLRDHRPQHQRLRRGLQRRRAGRGHGRAGGAGASSLLTRALTPAPPAPPAAPASHSAGGLTAVPAAS